MLGPTARASMRLGACAGADRRQPADRLSLDARSDRDSTGRSAGACDRQFPHRHGGDWLGCARDAGSRCSRLAVGDHHRAHDVSQPDPLSNGETVVTPRSDIKVG